MESNCSCYGYLQGAGRVLSTEKLFEDLADQMVHHPEHCDAEDFKQCKEFCSSHLSQMTDSFNLAAPLAKFNNTSLGQVICDAVGVNVSRRQVRLFASYKCSESASEEHSQYSESSQTEAATGDHAQTPLTCQDGKFVQE